MELKTAIRLIEKGIDTTKPQRWADLGAGGGLFTNALSQLLAKGSSIVAIDKTKSKIEVAEGIDLSIKTADFTKIDLDDVDGVMMANALHYVKDQKGFLARLPTRRIVLVEYNTDRSNPWVPYPISFDRLQSISDARLLAEAPSQYQSNGMYSALIVKKIPGM